MNIQATECNNNIFDRIEAAPADLILSIANAYRADPNPSKINVTVGQYRDNNEKPYVFEAVKKALAAVISDPDMNMEYLPVEGHAGFRKVAQELMFGNDLTPSEQEKIVSVHTPSGTVALRIGFDLLKLLPGRTVYISRPAWPVHFKIAESSGFKTAEYPYLNADCSGLEFGAMCDALENAESGSIVVLHVCAHNPTGVDPTRDQWEQLAKIFKNKDLVPFFDCAYQGFASGDIDRDVEAVRMFTKEGISMLVAQSFSKNFGLYGERVGALHVVGHNKETAEKVMSQLKAIVIPLYSFPPALGAKVVHTILSSEELKKLWQQELKTISERIQSVRQLLYNELTELKVKGTWEHFLTQIGMFSYSGLSVAQCEALIEKHHVYLTKNGRMSMSGLNTNNVKYLAKCIKEVVENN